MKDSFISFTHETELNSFLWFKNGEMYDEIILGDWFLLSQSDQMVYKFLMQNLQEAKSLTIGGVAPLNMVSCVSVMIGTPFTLILMTNIFFFTDFKNHLLLFNASVYIYRLNVNGRKLVNTNVHESIEFTRKSHLLWLSIPTETHSKAQAYLS